MFQSPAKWAPRAPPRKALLPGGTPVIRPYGCWQIKTLLSIGWTPLRVHVQNVTEKARKTVASTSEVFTAPGV
jgi:hypothetical protein